MQKVSGTIVDILGRRLYKGEVTINDGRIQRIEAKENDAEGYILPGFIDAHVHIESSMLTPVEFARLAVLHGTVATVSDPHEIANVLGSEGVHFMLDNGRQVPFKFNFGAPSCVPATSFETAGAVIGPEEIDTLLSNPEIRYLAEMMNYPGVLYNDPIVHQKLDIAKRHGKPIDGHAPALRGEDARRYIEAGISTDHECVSYDEALEKLQYGMKIIIREGSAAKNFDALINLLPEHYANMMFCSDDKHPDDLLIGHINQLVARAVNLGIDVFSVLQAACLNPIAHYGLDVGQLREGDTADFIVVDNLTDFNVYQTYINGEQVAANGKTHIASVPTPTLNNFNVQAKSPADFVVRASGNQTRVIEALDGELITRTHIATLPVVEDNWIADTIQDILKIAVVNRYQEAPVAVAFIKNFGLKRGAIASCVGHDSHNIIAVGTTDTSLCRAVNLIIEHRGGISATDGATDKVLPLPIAGIMSPEDGYTVGHAYAELDGFAKSLGSTLHAPFMTLSFMGLLVIPSLKLSDKGLFDGDKFSFVELGISEN